MASLPNWGKIAKLPQMIVEIDFENDSVMIKPESYRTLGMIADALHHPNLWAYKFLIVGHASSTGSDKHNLELSEKRSAASRRFSRRHSQSTLNGSTPLVSASTPQLTARKAMRPATDASSLSIWVSSRRRNAASGRETTNARPLVVRDGWPLCPSNKQSACAFDNGSAGTIDRKANAPNMMGVHETDAVPMCTPG